MHAKGQWHGAGADWVTRGTFWGGGTWVETWSKGKMCRCPAPGPVGGPDAFLPAFRISVTDRPQQHTSRLLLDKTALHLGLLCWLPRETWTKWFTILTHDPVINEGHYLQWIMNPKSKRAQTTEVCFSLQTPSVAVMGEASASRMFPEPASLPLATLTSSRAALANRTFCRDGISYTSLSKIVATKDMWLSRF